MNLPIRKIITGMAGATIAVGVGAAHAHSIFLGEGTEEEVGVYECSPHGATKSGGGSIFSGCENYDCFQGYYPWDWTCTSEEHHRSFTCAKGTACANALCGSTKALKNGNSYSNGGSSHGKNGGHSAFVNGYTCY